MNSIKALVFYALCLTATSLDAAVIEVEWSSIQSVPNETGLLTRSYITGVATSITGFVSLEGIAPSRLTYEAGHSTVLEQTGSPSTSDSAYVRFGGNEQEPAYWDVFLDGNRIASSTDPTFTLETDFTRPNFPSMWRTDIPVTGIVGTEFYEEIMQLTEGIGTLHFVSDESSGASSDGRFAGTGRMVASFASDFDGSGVLDVDDIDLLAAAIRQGNPITAFDVDGSGQVDVEDFDYFIHSYMSTWYGDANLDGEFNSTDLIDVLAAATYEADVAAGWATGDFNGSGRFNATDLIDALADGGYEAGHYLSQCSWLCSWGSGGPGLSNVSAVPEPASAVLLLVGMTVVCRRRR